MPRLSKIGAAALAAFGWTSGSAVTASYLVVAGGGGAGCFGGGGAGGFLSGTTSLNPTLSYTVTVGAGGAGIVSGPSGGGINGSNGNNSQFGTLTASVGGGSGGGYITNVNGSTGGSGGGGGYFGTAGAATSGQGNAGGVGNIGGAGGGGANAVGSNGGGSGSAGVGGAGGNGLANPITGSTTGELVSGTYYLAGGGGGGNGDARTGGSGGAGGDGGGGDGSTGILTTGTAGTANTGGGGGGGGSGSSTNYGGGGQGGSGVVIISYVGAQQFGGGVVTSSGGSTIHTFNTSGTLSPLSSLTASCLVIAGGGGGGSLRGGGGGAGGYRTGSGITIDTNSIYAITVGGGGAGGGGGGSNTANFGTTGSNSSFSTITSNGGGGGGKNFAENGLSGGSGGGSGPGAAGSGGAGNTPSTSPSQGNNGGNGGASIFSGGGGGAGGVGGTGGTASTSGAGGAGTSSSITGSAVTRAGGGGGGSEAGAGGGGAGGGGDGTTGATTAEAGDVNTGSGGGGGGYDAGSATSGAGGAGGSGVVIISYPGTSQQMAGGTVTVAGGNVIHTFTSSGYLTPIVLVNNSLRFRASNNNYLARTYGTPTNNKVWTWSAWVKRGSLSLADANHLFMGSAYDVGSNPLSYSRLVFETDNTLTLGSNNSAGEAFVSSSVYRDPAAWYHIVLSMDASNTIVRCYVNGTEITYASRTNPTNTNTEINKSGNYHRMGFFRTAEPRPFDGYMADINFIDGLALTPNSFGTSNGLGVWQPIRYGGSYGTNGFYLPFTANTESYAGFFGGSGYSIVTSATQIIPATGDFTIEAMINFADLSTYPVICSQGTSGTAGRTDFLVSNTGYISLFTDAAGAPQSAAGVITTNRWYYVAATRSGSNTAIYVNGILVASSSSSLGTIQNTTFKIGVDWGGDYISSGYVSNVRVSNVVRTISPATAPTTNFTNDASTVLLTLQGATVVDNSSNAYALTNNGTVTLGKTYPFAYKVFNDQSPQGNNWTPNNISGITGTTLDYMTDVPTLTSATTANYCVLNPLQTTQSATAPTNGNLTSPANAGVWRRIGSTMQLPTTGKFYFEYNCDSFSSFATFSIGVFSGALNTANEVIGISSTEWGYNAQSGYASNNSSNISSGFTTATTGDVLQLAYDASTGSLWFGKNNTWQGASSPNPSTGTSPTYTGVYNVSPVMVQNWATQSVNFGQRPFAYTPPTDFKALNTFNLPTPTIGATAATTANKYFDITLWTGDNTTPRSITNSGSMQPDFVWLKSRSNAYQHTLYDSVRGAGSAYALSSDSTSAEGGNANVYGYLSAFNSNGFAVTQGTAGSGGAPNGNAYTNQTSTTYVAWQWRASNAAGVSNTAGAITSTVSANTTTGFSIVTYTGTGGTGTTTVGHGCQVGGSPTAPSMVIIKRRNASANWAVYLTSLTSTSYYLVLNSTAAQANYGSTFISPSSSTLTIAADSSLLNTSTGTYVAYCFAEVAGYSKFGSYIGTGAGDSNGPFIYCGFRPALIIIKVDTVGYNWAMMDIERPGYNSISYRIFADVANEETTVGDPQLDFLSNGFKLKAGNANYAGTAWFMAFAENPFKYSNAR